MERREEIARIIADLADRVLDAESPEDVQLAEEIGTDAIFALDWTEPGLRRAVEIVERHTPNLAVNDPRAEGEVRRARKIKAALEAEINGGTDGG